MAHGVVRTDNMWGTDVRAGLVSVKYMEDGGDPSAIDNGQVLVLNGLLEGEREIFAGIEPRKGNVLEDLVLIATPEVMYDERLRNLDEFYNAVDKPCRGYRLHKGDIFSLTIDALDADEDPAVGDEVFLVNGSTKLAVGTAGENNTHVGEIIAIDVVGRYTYYVIEVG